MRLPFIALVFFLFSSITSSAQSKLGDVASVFITTADLDSSVACYEKLGFTKIGSNTFPFPWAQVSDGSLLIMIKKDAVPYIGLTYYVNDIDEKVAQLEKDSIVFAQKPKAGDPIKRYFIKSPDGFNIALVSNIGNFQQPTGITMLNMKPADYTSADKYPNQQCGVFGEFCHPVKDLNVSVAFWKKLGFTEKGGMKGSEAYSIVSDGLMIIGLHQTKEFNYPAITYFGINAAKRIQQLKDKGLNNLTEMRDKNNVVLKTWEQQHIFIFSFGM